MGLPYDMGNAGDLLKHGVLAEFVRWRCEQAELERRRCEQSESFRFIDLFGGEPCNQSAPDVGAVKRAPKVAERFRELPEDLALRMAQIEIEKDRYYGSGLLVKKIAKQVGGDVCVLVNDSCPKRRKRLEREEGLFLLKEEFSGISADAYEAFEEIVCQGKLEKGDLVLIDPFDDFLNPNKGEHYKEVIPQIKETIKQDAAVILFALNKNPCKGVGQKFDQPLKKQAGA